jgi:hypothetical protein
MTLCLEDNQVVVSESKDNLEEKSKNEEWGAWKFVSNMLDTPDPNGIYQTSKCYELIHDFVVEQKAKARKEATEAHKVEMERAQKEIDHLSNYAQHDIQCITQFEEDEECDCGLIDIKK